MHSKIKGNIGQFGIANCLAKNGYSVFTEQGDISKIDIIAEKNGKLIRIQCKAITPINGCLALSLKKSGPNYQFHYSPEMFDYFGIYDLENDKCYFVSSSILTKLTSQFNLRLCKPKDCQTKNINFAEDFLISAILRD